jgi:nucleoside-diphosphate kinase
MKHFKDERTLIIIKPDGIQRSLVGEIIGRFERVGLKIVAMKALVPTKDQAKIHYTLEKTWLRKVGEKAIKAYLDKNLVPPQKDPIKAGEKVLSSLIKYMTSGPVITFVLEGAHAVAVVRKLVGSTEPLTSDVGTIRGDFVLDSYQMSDTDNRSVRNLIHASGSPAEAQSEMRHWFKKEEIINYKHVQEKILYSTDISDILG